MTSSTNKGAWGWALDFSDLDGPLLVRKRVPRSSVAPHIQEAAARLVKQKRVVTVFLDELNHAGALVRGNEQQRTDARQVALAAVLRLLATTGKDHARHFGRVFRALSDEHKPAEDSDRNRRDDNVKGATAFLVEYLASLPGQSRRVEMIAHRAAYVLTERAFPFTGKNASSASEERGRPQTLNNPLVLARGKTIELWRRRYRAKKPAPDRAADVFRKYRDKSPFKTTGTSNNKAQTAIAWWYEQLLENDY